uniref:Heat shock protein 70 n=1 Tax=Panagrolaimus sp. ES5 TaxID=591445 RepID=A0AC34FXT7_9BILA
MRHKFEYTVYDSKRIIGKEFERIATDPLWPFTISMSEENVYLQTKACDGKPLLKRPEEISAALLHHIKTLSEQYQSKILDEVVITIPSEFSKKQKEATKTAAEMAGWKTIHFIPEPVAAAFAYFMEIEIPNQSNILICDCGGGTVDICIAKVINDRINVLAFNGDSYLGGRDFDKVLYNHFNAILKHKYGINVKDSNRKYILNQQCQDIKHNLSTAFEDS